MNRHLLLAENENKRLTIRLPLLICFAMFAAWQFGVMAYSGTAFSIDGKTPLPIDAGNLIPLVVTGYILSVSYILLFPHFIVWAGRITTGIALLCAAVLFLPISLESLAVVYQVQYFCCIFMIGLESALVIDLFNLETAIKYLFIAYVFAFAIAAVLQNDIVPVPFSVFRVFMIIALILMLAFFFKIPTRQWPRHAKKHDGLACPNRLLAGLWIYVGLVGFLSSFGLAIAENTGHGVAVFYLSASTCSTVIFVLWKRFGISPVKSGAGLTGLIALGATFGVISLFVPAFSLISCALFGCGLAAVNIGMFYGLIISKQYPSRIIAPAIITITLVGMTIYSALLEVLRENMTALYIVALALSVGMVMIYMFVEPYLGYYYRGRSLQNIIGIVAEEPDEDGMITEFEDTKQTPVPEDTPLNVRRMQNLMRLSITPLTSREYQVADLIMQGMKRQEIADTLNIKPDTISKHRNAIYSKFGIHRRQELFAIADRLDAELAEKGGGDE